LNQIQFSAEEFYRMNLGLSLGGER
jgi:hypothetical protein